MKVVLWVEHQAAPSQKFCGEKTSLTQLLDLNLDRQLFLEGIGLESCISGTRNHLEIPVLWDYLLYIAKRGTILNGLDHNLDRQSFFLQISTTM